MAIAAIGLGANLRDRAATLREAVHRLEELGEIVAISSLYETAPVGYLDQPPFLNAAVVLETALPAPDLMTALLGIERDLGRVRTFLNAPRTLDLDLLLYDDLIVDTPGLILPHPRLHERAFVLVPLAEIAPNAIHPVLLCPVSVLMTEASEAATVKLWRGQGWTREE